MAAVEADKEAIWLNRLVIDLGLEQGVVSLYCDSKSALHYAENQKMDGRLKHIDIRYHYLCQLVEEKELHLIKIAGTLNPADALTKVIPLEAFQRHC